MIKNERQYKVTKSSIENFHKAIAAARERDVPEGTQPVMWQAYIDGMLSQLETLEREVREYERLASGAVDTFEIDNLEDFPRGLIMARIARRLTQKQLSERLDLRPQQIQRWEEEEYQRASFENLNRVAEALDVQVSERIALNAESDDAMSMLEKAGIPEGLLRKRIAPDFVGDVAEFLQYCAHDLKRIWNVQVLGSLVDTSHIRRDAASYARFKLPGNAKEAKVQAYAQYVYVISEIVARSMSGPVGQLSSDWEHVRQDIMKSGPINLEACVNFAWDAGIPVIPLSDALHFHGCCWKIEGRNVIALKQSVRSESRWSFDLLHELHHAACEPTASPFEASELAATDVERRNSQEERLANKFASDVLLNGRSTDLYDRILKQAGGQVPFIKKAVKDVARSEDVNVGVLANYVAARLKKQSDVDWWGTAANLQPESADALTIVRTVFDQRIDYKNMSASDERLVRLATAEYRVA
ncbi:protein of unknown function [Paracoccus pantotrophus]|nr:protein of unknown function [Paracoccus pantotrophus]